MQLQPEWRRKSRGGKPGWPLKRTPLPANEPWEALLRCGDEGFVLILLALAWWASLVSSPKDLKAWIWVVDDVDWVLHHLRTSGENQH